jgi:hypothetical protein
MSGGELGYTGEVGIDFEQLQRKINFSVLYEFNKNKERAVTEVVKNS